MTYQSDITPDASVIEMLGSLEEQLVALYEEKHQSGFGDNEKSAMTETIANLEAQLIELYKEKQTSEWGNHEKLAMQETIDNLESQLISIYAEKQEGGDLQIKLSEKDTAIVALRNQLNNLYQDMGKLAQKWITTGGTF